MRRREFLPAVGAAASAFIGTVERAAGQKPDHIPRIGYIGTATAGTSRGAVGAGGMAAGIA